MTHPPHQEPEKGETRKLAEQALYCEHGFTNVCDQPEHALVVRIERACQAARKEALEWAINAVCGYCEDEDTSVILGPDGYVWDHLTPEGKYRGKCFASRIRSRLAALASPPQSKER